jgi:hypothetical protein
MNAVSVNLVETDRESEMRANTQRRGFCAILIYARIGLYHTMGDMNKG